MITVVSGTGTECSPNWLLTGQARRRRSDANGKCNERIYSFVTKEPIRDINATDGRKALFTAVGDCQLVCI